VTLPVEVIEAVREGRCAIFVGSRFAAEAVEIAGGSPLDGRGLAKALDWKPPRPLPGRARGPVTPSVQTSAAVVEARDGRTALEDRLAELVGVQNFKPTSAHEVVVARFGCVFTTAWDTLLEQAAADAGRSCRVVGRSEPVPENDGDELVLVRMRGAFGNRLCVTEADHVAQSMADEERKKLRQLIRKNVVLFVGYRPDEEEFEVLFEELTEAYGGELPRCHLAVAQGRIDDYQWQRWVWRGLLLFTADPTECMNVLEEQLNLC
jgi:hypothetical protein